MTSRKFETNSKCVGGRHNSAKKNILGEITSKVSKVIIGPCSPCKGKKSITVNDNTKAADGLGDFIKNLGKKGLNFSKKIAKNVLKNPRPALDIKANVASAVASRNLKQASSTLPELITF